MLANGTVYIGASSGGGPAMYAVNASTGANVWPAPIPLTGGTNVRSTVAFSTDIGVLYVAVGAAPGATQTGVTLTAVSALRLADGSLAWNGPAIFPGPAPAGLSIGYAGSGAQPGAGGVLPALVQAAVFVASGQNVLALSAYTGNPIWTRTLTETSLQVPVLSTAASTPSTLYVGGASGRVYALNSLTGLDAPGGMLPIAPISGPLALAGNVLFVPTTTGLIAADATSGAPLWSSPLPAATAVAVAGDSPYVGTTDGRLVGFSR
jgi:outer membrane protein assembly factor BamB